MTKAKHTPGPWEYRPTKYHDWGTVCVDGFVLCQAREPKTVMDAEFLNEHRRNGTDPWEANARLIAAAPDLLEALEAMLSHTNGWDEAQLRKRWGEQVVAEILAARAAIAKAKGEAQ
jgi:hypothetical protein